MSRARSVANLGNQSLNFSVSDGALKVGSGSTIETTGESQFSGIVTASQFVGDGSGLTSLTGASAGTYGASTNTPIITVDSNGRITGIATVATAGAGGGGGISNIVEDTTPQLGGNLDVNSKDITGTGNVNLTGVITATSARFTGNVSVGGTLTYEDVTNIDSIGIVTARAGIKVLNSAGADISGVVTATSFDGTLATSNLSGTITNAQLAGSIANAKLSNSSVSFGGVSVDLGASDATPAFDLSDATNYPTSSLSGTITNAQLAGSIANDKLANSTVSFGGVSAALGQSDATPAFDLSDAINYPTSSLSGTITNAQLAGSIANAKLANSSVSYGGVSVDLGASDATPAFDLSDATNYPTSSLSGTITNAQLAGSIADDKLASTFLKNVVEDTTPQLGGNLDLNSNDITGTGNVDITGNITSSGNIEAQNITVTSNLTVNGTTTTLDTVVTEVDRLEVAANNTTVGVAITQSGSGDILNLYDGSTEVFSVADGGNVNIGPSANANGHGLLTLSQSASSAFNALVIQQGNTAFTASDGLHIGIDANVDAYFKLFENRDFIFYTGTTNTEKLRITSDGNVGIGTDNPNANAKLHVIGGLGIYAGSTTNDAVVRIFNDGSNSYLESTYTGGAGYKPLVLKTGGSNRLTITATGDLGLGVSDGFSGSAGSLYVVGGQGIRWTHPTNGTFYGDHYVTSGGEQIFRVGSGLNEKLRINSSGVTVTGVTTATSFVKSGGTSSQYLMADGSVSTGGGGGDTVSIESTATDILSVSSGAISADDAGADKLVFWDDSAGKLTYLTVGSNLTVTDTTIAASGGGGGGISNIVEDTSPQLGGNLNTNGNRIAVPDSSGVNVNRVTFGDAKDLQIYHDGSNSYISDAGTGNLLIRAEPLVAIQDTSGNNSAIFNDGGTVELYHNNSLKFTTQSYGIDVTGTITADGLDMEDSQKILLGTGDDLEIYHDGSNSIINDAGTGDLKLQRGGYDRLTLNSNGVEVNLHLKIKDDYALRIGDDHDLRIYETNSDIAINYNGTGTIFMRTGGDWKVDKNGSNRIYAHSSGAVDLYYNGSKKLETTNTGITVTGAVTATSIVKSGGTSSQFLMADGSVSTGGGGGGGGGSNGFAVIAGMIF